MIKDVHINNRSVPFSRAEGRWCQHDWLALRFREIEGSEAARRSRLLCSHRNSPILSVSLRPLRSLNYNNPRPPCSIRWLLNTHDGATNTPSKGLSPGIALNLD